MSTLRVDNFGPSAGGTTYSAGGIAKSLLAYDQVAVSVDMSTNVSSVTDQAAGRFSANHTNVFSTADEPEMHYSNSGERFIDPTRLVDTAAMHLVTRTAGSAYSDYAHNHAFRAGDLA